MVKKLSDFYTAHEAAKETGIEYKTLLMRISRGKVQCEKLGRMKLIPTTEVARLKGEQTS